MEGAIQIPELDLTYQAVFARYIEEATTEAENEIRKSI